MKICSVTICPTPEDSWDAVATVEDLVDDTVLLFPDGPIKDFSEARNAALAECVEEGCDWAIMLDTDERIHTEGLVVGIPDTGYGNGLPMNRSLLHAFLESTEASVLMVRSSDLGYEKERIFRLPARGHYKGPTHECFVLDEGASRKTLSGITFTEESKTLEQYRLKAERDREILEAYTQEHPDDPRWWYYLGDTYAGLGMPYNALSAFEACWELNGWDEESAWAAYRASVICAEEDHDYQEAIEWCAAGMQRHPGIAELPWLAGWCCYQLGRYQHAIWWSEMALGLNGVEAHLQRINFRYAPALNEAPWDVIRWSYRMMGNPDGENYGDKGFEQALKK